MKTNKKHNVIRIEKCLLEKKSGDLRTEIYCIF